MVRFDVNIWRRMILGFEESEWRKEYSFGFVRFGSAVNVHFQSKLGKVVEYEEYAFFKFYSIFKY